jgi:hypothetical protein
MQVGSQLIWIYLGVHVKQKEGIHNKHPLASIGRFMMMNFLIQLSCVHVNDIHLQFFLVGLWSFYYMSQKYILIYVSCFHIYNNVFCVGGWIGWKPRVWCIGGIRTYNVYNANICCMVHHWFLRWTFYNINSQVIHVGFALHVFNNKNFGKLFKSIWRLP